MLVEMLYIDGEWSGNKSTDHLSPPHDAVEKREPLAQAIRELHRPEYRRTGAGEAVWQQPPLERLDVSPMRMFGIERKLSECTST